MNVILNKTKLYVTKLSKSEKLKSKIQKSKEIIDDMKNILEN